MPSVLLIPDTKCGFYHAPQLIALLQNKGFEVSVACSDSSMAGFICSACDCTTVDLKRLSAEYDLVLAAPFDVNSHLPERYSRLVVAPVSAEASSHCPKNAVMVPDFGNVIDMGLNGKCAVASPEQCLEAVLSAFCVKDFDGMSILLTAGPTIEDADPARFVSNRSTGRMGTAIARMALRRGARVVLVHGPMIAEIPQSTKLLDIPVRSAFDMCDAVLENIGACQIAILCAAVADFAPVAYSEEKIKKGKSQLFNLQMKRTPDILATVGALESKPFLVGFAAESNDVSQNAQDKLVRKNCDMLCANDITAPGCGFATSTNSLSVFMRNGESRIIPLAAKEQVADSLLDLIKLKLNAF